ncbi:MAG TPA: DUF998 domain-containing protein [Ktedonobacteraceae bacterium]|nr:DUF998 domain-containing protein [Ktedonobacteraceae bacterium]
MQHVISQESTSYLQNTKLTKALLICGIVAGPLFTIVGLTQAFTRPGFDLTRHALSLLENGDLGWIQITCFLLTGLLFVACAVGMRQVMHGSRGGTWGPVLIAVLGVGMICAAFFRADPGLGFPPGTPANANTLSWHGLGHLIVGTISFIALIAVCFVFARRFAFQHLRGWAIYSVVTGVLFFVSLAGLSTGHLWLNSAFVFTTLNALVWVSVMAAKLLIEQRRTSA